MAGGPLVAVLTGGGSGERFKAAGYANKLLAPLGGRPVFTWALETLLQFRHPELAPNGLAHVVMTVRADDLPVFAEVADTLFHEPLRHGRLSLVAGGPTRRASVRRGLKHLDTLGHGGGLALIQDAARPLLTSAMIADTVSPLLTDPTLAACAVGHPVTDTLKQVRAMAGEGAQVVASPPREQFWQVQTPQVFRWQPLWEAEAFVGQDIEVTDDLQLVGLAFSKAGQQLVRSAIPNYKLTQPTDLGLLAACIDHSLF